MFLARHVIKHILMPKQAFSTENKMNVNKKKSIHLIYIFCDSSTHIDQQSNDRKRFFLARKILLVTNKLNNIYNQ